MKKLILVSAIAMGGLFYNTANAQIRFHVGVNLPHVYINAAAEPQAAAAYIDDNQANYDNNDDYYYLPDVDAYYNVAEQSYYYNDGDNWVSAAYLPGEYRDYDWRTARRFEVRAPRPYLHNDVYMARYHGANNNWANRDYQAAGRYTNAGRFNNDANGAREQRFNNGNSYGQRFNGESQGNYGQNFNNRGQRSTQQFDQNQGRAQAQNDRQFSNQGRGNAMGQQRVTQNSRGYEGHGRMNRF